MMGIIVKAAKAALKFLTGPFFIITSIAIIVAILVWIYGDRLRIGDFAPLAKVQGRLYAELVILGLWAGIVILMQMLKIRALNRDPSEDLKAAKEAEKPSEDPRLGSLKERFEHLVSVLRTSDMGVSAVRTMPWYLMLGASGAGKTNLLAQSDLELPNSNQFGQDDRINVKSTKLLDFWVSQDAIFLDIDGNLADHSHDQTAGVTGWPDQPIWERLLKLIGTVRRRRPLNGVVLVVDISRLITQNEDERVKIASLIRARLKELIASTGSQIPIYVALTKLDLLDGCHGFFRSLSRQQRERLMGMSFRLFRGREDSSWTKEFDTQYERMLNAIQEQALVKASETQDQQLRLSVYNFVRQMAGLKEPLTQFLNDCFVADRFSTPALIRGIYFTSSRQEAVPINGLEQGVSANYGLTLFPRAAQIAKTGGYFGRALFSQAIIPEAGIASDNIRVENARRRALLIIIGVMSLLTIALGAIWFNAARMNELSAGVLFGQVETYISSEQGGSNGTEDLTGRAHVPSLNTLRQARESYGDFESARAHVAGLGLYRGSQVAPKVDQLYNAAILDPFLTQLHEGVGAQVYERLSQAPDDLGEALNYIASDQDASMSEEQSKAVLEALRVYRFMIEPETRVEHAATIQEYFRRVWSDEFEGKAVLQADLATHLRYALTSSVEAKTKSTDNPLFVRLDEDEDLVTQAQARILTIPRSDRVYADILKNARIALPSPLYLRDEMGPVFDQLYTNGREDVNISLSRIYSARSYQRYFKVQNQNTALATSEDAWVLGLTENTSFSDADIAQFQTEVRERYVGDFIALWRTGLTSMQPKSFDSLMAAEQTLETLVSSVDPLGRLLRSIEANTKFEAPLVAAAETDTPADAREAITQSADAQVASRINRAFQRLHSFDDPIDDGASYYEEAMVAVEALYEYVKAINESASPQDAAFEQAKARAELSGPDPILELERVANGLPSPLREHLRHWADETWRVILVAAEQRIEEVYVDEVLAFYDQRLAFCYPFTSTASVDCEIVDFEAYFANGGIFESFVDNYLSKFVRTENNTSSNPLIQVGGRTMALAGDFVGQLEQVRSLQKAFLQENGGLGMSFSITPLSISSRAGQAVISVDGQTLSYSHGFRRPTTFVWPNTLESTAETRIALSALNNIQEVSISETGLWNWYRMLRRGAIQNIGPNYVDLGYNVQGEPLVIRVKSDTPVNGITSELLATYRPARTILAPAPALSPAPQADEPVTIDEGATE